MAVRYRFDGGVTVNARLKKNRSTAARGFAAPSLAGVKTRAGVRASPPWSQSSRPQRPVYDWHAPEDPFGLRGASPSVTRRRSGSPACCAIRSRRARAFWPRPTPSGEGAVLAATASWPFALRLAIERSAGGRSGAGHPERKCETALQRVIVESVPNRTLSEKRRLFSRL
jgi:hypothetical protein